MSGYAAHGEGFETSAWGQCSHAEGYKTLVYLTDTKDPTLSGWCAHAEGFETSAIGYASHADGVHSISKHKHSYAWNGNIGTPYESKGDGTFCINPKGGLKGIYIGGKPLEDLIKDIVAGS